MMTNCIAPEPDENPEKNRVPDILEFRFLENRAGVDWSRIEPFMYAAEPAAMLKGERDRALRCGQKFGKQEELKRAEDALRVVNACRYLVGARVIERMRQLYDSLDEEPKSRFSDAAIEEVFGRLLHGWHLDPADEEMANAMRRFFWRAEHEGKGNR